MFKRRAPEQPASVSSGDWGAYLDILRDKWDEVPAGNVRMKTTQLELLHDEKLLDTWRRAASEGGEARDWYRVLYGPVLKDKFVLDVGSGFALDTIDFALHGAKVTFLDIVESNLRILRRICGLLGLENVDFCYLKDAKSLERLGAFDVLWCQGSMICSPFEVAKGEARDLLKHLKTGGRWIELAYPRIRWEREGRLPFEKWGRKTDGGAPWMEWYDLRKLTQRLEPARFLTILNYEFHSGDFVWFDLMRLE